MKVGDLVTWRNPREMSKSDFRGYGLIIDTEMMGHLGDLRQWLIVKWSNGKTESTPQWLLASRVKVISEAN